MKLVGMGVFGYMLAQVAAPLLGDYGPIAQLGAVGVLAWLTKALLGELRDARADSTKQREEHSAAFQAASQRWHDDSAAMQTTMMRMVETCSATRRDEMTHADDREASRVRRQSHPKPE